jgi:hypothetical protein
VEVAKFLPNNSVGGKLAKGHWKPGFFYQLTWLKVSKVGLFSQLHCSQLSLSLSLLLGLSAEELGV